jgi:hypothetical protein
VKVDRFALEILVPVIDSAREELSDMESDDIPASLRKASKSSARRLPPPLARTVVDELMRSDGFRSLVAERYRRANMIDADLVQFLEAPDEAMERISVRASIARDEGVRSDLRDTKQRVGELESQLAEAKRRNAALLTEHEQDLESARSSVSMGQHRAEARIEKMDAEQLRTQREVTALKLELAALSNELDLSEERVASAVRRSRRRGEGGDSSGQPHRIDSTPSDPLELAIWLDAMERNVRPFTERGPAAGADVVAEPLRIDPGIAPDSGAVLASLLAQQPRRFLLDGYNIGGEVFADGFSTRSARDDVVHRAGRLARSTHADVLVIFDGPNDEGRKGFRSADGAIVRFSRGDKADDVIAALVASDPEGTVVITNDRDLRDRCTIDGCIAIWSTAFLEWL